MVEIVFNEDRINQLQERLAPPGRELGTQSATLLDVLAGSVRTHPEAVAVDAPDACLTYEELARRVRELGQRLRRMGVGAGDRIGIRIPSGTAELYVGILGALHAGAAYVPVDAEDPDARAEMVWSGAGACAVIGEGLEIVQRSPAGGQLRDVRPEDDAWVIFTSGSTGAPKGVAISHRSAAAFIAAEQSLWRIEPQDRVLAGLSVGFDASCEEMWSAWANGAALVPAPRRLVRAAAELGGWVAERKISVISTVPTLAAMWDEADLEGVRLLILGGEACPEPLAWRLSANREVWNTYGPTEATVVSTAARLRPGAPITIGWALSGWELAIVDDGGNPAALGEAGELVIAGVGLGRYLDRELDSRRFAELPALGWERAYRTGDVVRETVYGLEFIGRRDDQVKLGGRRLELGEVDALISGIPGVRAGAAAVQKSEAGNPLLVAYYVGSPSAEEVRASLLERLPSGVVPLVVALEELPQSTSGKVSRKALPWPPPAPRPTHSSELSEMEAWLAARWTEQLGPLPIGRDSDFFTLGGSSLAAAKLVSVVRERYPAVAVADVYNQRTLGALASRLEALAGAGAQRAQAGAAQTSARGWSAAHLAALFAVFVLSSPQWLLGLLAFDRLAGVDLAPSVGWGWLIGGWIVFGSVPGRSLIVLAARRLLLAGLRPGRYPRRSWLTIRIWFLERLAEAYRSEALAGTPFAARWARLCGHRVAADARLGALPPVSSLVRIGSAATVEADVDMHGWWFEGSELVLGEVEIGARARVGSRALLAPGVVIGEGAEVEPGSVVTGNVPAGERWAGSPAARVGDAGEAWPQEAPPVVRTARLWKAMFVLGMWSRSLLALAAVAPAYLILISLDQVHEAGALVGSIMIEAPIFAITFLATYALLIALAVRATGRLIRPGLHPDAGSVGWALWFTGGLMEASRSVLFSLYSSLYTRAWLRLAGIPVGRRAEVSTVVGASRLTEFAERSFCADDVMITAAVSRDGWLRVEPVSVGAGSFLGNGAIIPGGAHVGEGCTIGVLTHPPQQAPTGTSWFGVPALELPRVADCVDSRRTVTPSRRLILARGTMDLIRILLPATASVALAGLVFWALESISRSCGAVLMALSIPFVLIGAGVVATALTVAAKWLIIGRYKPGQHPLWSFFVWRDEILNSLQDQLAGTWLIGTAMGTPVMPVYLRAMGAKVGRGVWVESLTITEFDVVDLGDDVVVNRHACVETHLFHDRLMRIGPTRIGFGSSLGPACAVLPDTVLGEGVHVGGRAVVMRGEELPPCSRWQGAPVVSA